MHSPTYNIMTPRYVSTPQPLNVYIHAIPYEVYDLHKVITLYCFKGTILYEGVCITINKPVFIDIRTGSTRVFTISDTEYANYMLGPKIDNMGKFLNMVKNLDITITGVYPIKVNFIICLFEKLNILIKNKS